MPEQSLGEYRVGVAFNPSGDTDVHKIKVMTAALIDAIMRIPVDPAADNAGEVARLRALAATAAEESAMWAVKAITKPTREEVAR